MKTHKKEPDLAELDLNVCYLRGGNNSKYYRTNFMTSVELLVKRPQKTNAKEVDTLDLE